ncbi:MAG: phosphatidylglycerophosphatase A [Thermodesulfobacteriota bacterium]|nr:phosphatidylglycerophosphatase A [Thermodesulfobacteriota bacterium]
MTLTQHIIMMLATGFYVGKIPVGPGTFGTIAGLVFVFLLSLAPLPAVPAILALIVGLSIWVAHEAERQIGTTDPGCIVIDEIAGVMVGLAGIPFEFWPVLAGFVVFRVLDISKPFPIRWLDKKLPGGPGIVADDVVAGILTNFIVRGAMAMVS